MNADWQNYLGAQGARVVDGSVYDFGDAARELVAARDATVAVPMAQMALLEFTGEDACTFLHNQLTSDVNHLEEARAQYAAWCSPKGRMLASFLLFRRGANYLAMVPADLVDYLQKRFQMYVLRSKVKINRRPNEVIVGLSGSQAATALREAGLTVPESALGTTGIGQSTIICLDDTRFIAVLPVNAALEAWPRFTTVAAPAGTPTWQWLDIVAGIPWITTISQDAFVPQMVNFDGIGGVSFHKGCYPGQEVVARARYLGKVKRHLYRAHATAPIMAGAAVVPMETPESPCGQIVNAAAAPGGGYDVLAVVLEETVGSGKLQVVNTEGAYIDLSGLILTKE